jgi:hypothetical protein
MAIAGIVLGYISVIGGLLIAPLAIVLTQRTQHRKRELEHIERLRALECGRTLPQDEPWWSPLRVALWIGGAVPLGIFLSVGAASSAAGYHEGMWLAAAIVGTASVISGAVLAGQSLNQRTKPDPINALKPYVEEDAYDTVGARG